MYILPILHKRNAMPGRLVSSHPECVPDRISTRGNAGGCATCPCTGTDNIVLSREKINSN